MRLWVPQAGEILRDFGLARERPVPFQSPRVRQLDAVDDVEVLRSRGPLTIQVISDSKIKLSVMTPRRGLKLVPYCPCRSERQIRASVTEG